jgi:hypothetical protein
MPAPPSRSRDIDPRPAAGTARSASPRRTSGQRKRVAAAAAARRRAAQRRRRLTLYTVAAVAAALSVTLAIPSVRRRPNPVPDGRSGADPPVEADGCEDDPAARSPSARRFRHSRGSRVGHGRLARRRRLDAARRPGTHTRRRAGDIRRHAAGRRAAQPGLDERGRLHETRPARGSRPQHGTRGPRDPRLQQFVDTFRSSPRYSPEYGEAVDGVPVGTGGRPAGFGATEPKPPGTGGGGAGMGAG